MSFNEILILSFEILGTAAFAISGAMTAVDKKMDIFGVSLMGILTALGGGMTRDIILGITPPTMFRNPIYAIVAFFASSLYLLFVYLRKKHPEIEIQDARLEWYLTVFDAVGLGVFTPIGINCAIDAGYGNNAFFLVFLGTLTGIGGGIIRDICSAEMPAVFRKRVYAVAAIFGSIVYILLYRYIPVSAAMYASGASIVIIRLLAAKFCWNLPRITWED